MARATKRKADKIRFVMRERFEDKIWADVLASCFARASASNSLSRPWRKSWTWCWLSCCCGCSCDGPGKYILTFPSSFSLFLSFYAYRQNVNDLSKLRRWHDSNPGHLALEATALPSVPHPRLKKYFLLYNGRPLCHWNACWSNAKRLLNVRC